jgi:hypothetical protein
MINKKCTKCGLEFTNPMPTNNELNLFYKETILILEQVIILFYKRMLVEYTKI